MHTRKAPLAVLVSGIVALGLILPACGGAEKATPTPLGPQPSPGATPTPTSPVQPTPTPVPSPTPTRFLGAVTPTPTPAGVRVKTGGTLRMRELSPFEPMDSYDIRSKFGVLWLQNILSNLIRQDPAQPAKLIPDLADRWDVSADGKTVTFFLHPSEEVSPASSRDLSPQERFSQENPEGRGAGYRPRLSRLRQ